MLCLLFVSFASATLKRGDDPYKILGVSKRATEADIKKAYRDVTRKYHPDVAKMDKKKAEQIFIRATDAYELLMDPKRKQLFDQTGSVSEEMEQESHGGYGYGYADPHSWFYGQRYQPHLDTIDTSNVESILKEHKEVFVFVYNSYSMRNYIQVFETVADELEEHSHFRRNDVQQGNYFATKYGVKTMPSIIYLRRNADGSTTHKVTEYGSPNTRESMIEWIEECWDFDIKVFKKFDKLYKWLNANKEYTRVVAIERGNDPSMAFKKGASKYRNCKYAILIDDYIPAIRKFKLTSIPVTLAFKNKKQKVLRTMDALEQMENPVLVRLDREVLETVCEGMCFMHAGEPNDKLFSNFSSFTEVATVWTPADSTLAKSMGLKKGEWALISGGKMKYKKVNIDEKYKHISSFLSGRMSMSTMTAKPDWTIPTMIRAGKKSVVGLFSSLNPMRLLNWLEMYGISGGTGFFVVIAFVLFILRSMPMS